MVDVDGEAEAGESILTGVFRCALEHALLKIELKTKMFV